MRDPFLESIASSLRDSSRGNSLTKKSRPGHSERAHSKFSASGAERWFNCPGSVELSEGRPDKSSIYAEEGTLAHEVLEGFLRGIFFKQPCTTNFFRAPYDSEMRSHATRVVTFISNLKKKYPGCEILLEDKVYLSFIHESMFGTYDIAIVDHFGTLHVFDFKYGKGHAVSVVKNLQAIFYCIGLAYKYDWNFKRVRAWIIQPRIKGYDGPTFWDIPTRELRRDWVPKFQRAVERVEKYPDKFVEGPWCWWCKAKPVCPLKLANKAEEAKLVFGGLD